MCFRIIFSRLKLFDNTQLHVIVVTRITIGLLVDEICEIFQRGHPISCKTFRVLRLVLPLGTVW